jgi:hypothetical protein
MLLTLGVIFLPVAARAQSSVAGNWQGAFEVDGTNLRLVLHIVASPGGTLTATIDSLDQDSPNIPVSSITFEGATLKLDVAQVKSSFEGKLNKEGTEIKGYWTEGKRLALKFKRITDSTKIVPPAPIGGDWQGTLIVDGKLLHVVLHLDTEHYTRLSASLDGIDEGANATPVNLITFTDNALRFTVDSLHGSYFGAVSADGNEIEGVWMQGQAFPLTFHRVLSPTSPSSNPERPPDLEECTRIPSVSLKLESSKFAHQNPAASCSVHAVSSHAGSERAVFARWVG